MTEAQSTFPTQVVEEIEEEDHETNTLGMWVFLAGEVMFFGALFTVYIIYRLTYPAAFAEGSNRLNVLLGTINTGILLTSSFTMALAVRSSQLGSRRGIIIFLLLTLVLGATFLGIKGIEYTQEFQEHLFPGRDFVFPGPNSSRVELFFVLYFFMTGLHAVHMIIGMGMILVLIALAAFKRFSAEHYSPVELTGLFWHFVDLVWIFLFPLLYLIHRS